MLTIEHLLIITAVLLFLGVVASKASSKLGVPALLLFLLVGVLAGSEGPGHIPFDNPGLAQSLGVVALAFILFFALIPACIYAAATRQRSVPLAVFLCIGFFIYAGVSYIAGLLL